MRSPYFDQTPRLTNRLPLLAGLAVALLALAQTGCHVPQPPGRGLEQRLVEPETRTGYWLYLPRDYVETDESGRRQRHWPTVVSFHGMRPFDTAHAQCREWQQEADRYGFVVIAPECRSMDVMAEFPVRTVHPGFKRDVDAALAILDQVFRNTHADPAHVLATGFSMGGYLAHYMVNHYPEKFSALAPRQANFTASILSQGATVRSRNHPILILNTQNDFDVCKKESRQAVRWYEQYGYRNMAWIYIKGLGHERTPDLAADFFARLSGVEASTPPSVLAKRQAIDGNPEGLAFLSGRMPQFERQPAPRQRPRPAADRDRRPDPRPSVTPSRRAQRTARIAGLRSPVSIDVSAAIGIEPLHLTCSAEYPEEWRGRASFLWTLDGQTLGSGENIESTIAAAGEYALGLLVIAPDNREYRVSRTIRVLAPVSASDAGRS